MVAGPGQWHTEPKIKKMGDFKKRRQHGKSNWLTDPVANKAKYHLLHISETGNTATWCYYHSYNTTEVCRLLVNNSFPQVMHFPVCPWVHEGLMHPSVDTLYH